MNRWTNKWTDSRALLQEQGDSKQDALLPRAIAGGLGSASSAGLAGEEAGRRGGGAGVKPEVHSQSQAGSPRLMPAGSAFLGGFHGLFCSDSLLVEGGEQTQPSLWQGQCQPCDQKGSGIGPWGVISVGQLERSLSKDSFSINLFWL